MCAVKGSEGDHKESSRVFPSIDQVREGPLGVAVTAQALDEPKPGRKTLDDCTDPVGVGITNISICRGTQTHTFAVELAWPCRMASIPPWLFWTVLTYSLTFTTGPHLTC